VLAELKKMKPNLYIGGKRVGRDDPRIRPGINVMSVTFDSAQEPEWKGLLTAVDELPADAVLVASEYEEEHFLTWQHLMFFQRCADLLTKPLLVSIPSNVLANELQALREAGVNGVVVRIESEQPAGRLKELRQVIDKLVFTAPRKTRKAEPLLPYPRGKMNVTTEGEEE